MSIIVSRVRLAQADGNMAYLLSRSSDAGDVRYYALYLTRATAGQELWFYYVPAGKKKHAVLQVGSRQGAIMPGWLVGQSSMSARVMHDIAAIGATLYMRQVRSLHTHATIATR